MNDLLLLGACLFALARFVLVLGATVMVLGLASFRWVLLSRSGRCYASAGCSLICAELHYIEFDGNVKVW